MGFRHEVYPFEWCCISSLTYSFPAEYLTSVILVLVTFPSARASVRTKLSLTESVTLDFSLAYLVMLFVSLPYFLSTMVYVCRKRNQQLAYKKMTMDKKHRRRHAHAHAHAHSDESDESH